jgi:hypothetical protein
MGCNSSAYILLKLLEMLQKFDMGNWKSKKFYKFWFFKKLVDEKKITWKGINWGVGLVVYWPDDEVFLVTT